MNGSSSGRVPSRAPIVIAVRSSARLAPTDNGTSVSAREISSDLHPGKALHDDGVSKLFATLQLPRVRVVGYASREPEDAKD